VIKKLSRLTSLTQTEISIFIFVLAMLCIGTGVKYLTAIPEQVNKKFSYAKEDSLYAYFNGLELDTAVAESESLFPTEKPFLTKNKEQTSYTKKTFSGLINLNTASLDQLTTLPGIGTKTAEQILSYRNRVKIIKSLDELLNIKGIGEKKISKLRSFLTLK
jgi:competence ComEA-like helix-hairpin-helix protein